MPTQASALIAFVAFLAMSGLAVPATAPGNPECGKPLALCGDFAVSGIAADGVNHRLRNALHTGRNPALYLLTSSPIPWVDIAPVGAFFVWWASEFNEAVNTRTTLHLAGH